MQNNLLFRGLLFETTGALGTQGNCMKKHVVKYEASQMN